jgi:hypothetical protein
VDGAYLSDISRNDGRFCEGIENIVEPWRKVGLAIFSKVHSRHGAQFDAQGLEEDGEDVGHQNDEEEFEPEGGTRSHIGGVISYF